MTDTPSDRPQYPPPGQGPGGSYPAGGYPATGRRNGIGVAALVIGVVALVLVLLLLFSPLGVLLGLIAVVLGILGLVRANRGEADNRGQAVAGLVTGAIALLLGIFFTISVGTWFATHVNDFRRFGNCMDQASGPAAREQCARRLSTDLE
jgi:Na+/H+ antiporter NhaD/arsenite permease-like protein